MEGVEAVIAELKELQSERVKVQKGLVAVGNQQKAVIRQQLGFDTSLEAEERDDIKTDVEAILKHIVDEATIPSALEVAANAVKPIVLNYELARKGYRAHRHRLTKAMESLAKELPVWSWVDGVRGAGALGLAQIVGELGRDMTNFPNPAKLWAWFGLGVNEHGRAQGRDGGPCPKRKKSVAEMSVGRSLIRQNKDGYRELYEERRRHTAETHPDWTDGHSHNDARRIVTKRFLRDLWKEWHRNQNGNE